MCAYRVKRKCRRMNQDVMMGSSMRGIFGQKIFGRSKVNDSMKCKKKCNDVTMPSLCTSVFYHTSVKQP